MASPTPRILMLLENNPYPQDVRVRMEAQELVQAGYQVSIICPKDPDKTEPWRENVDGVYAYRYPTPPELDSFLGFVVEYGYSLIMGFIYTFIVLFHRGFDIIHAHNPPDIYVFIALLFKPFGKKFVFDHHDLTPEVYNARYENGGNPRVYKTLLWMEGLTCRTADHIISTNQSYKTLISTRHNLPLSKFTIVRNGPRLEKWPVDLTPDPDLRQRASTILGYAGAMGKQDGIDYFLRALKHLIEDCGETDVLGLILGDGDEMQNLQQLAQDLGIADYVFFAGWVTGDTFKHYLATADICVDPDPKNDFNDHSTMIKMMEYMAVGKPIVAFDLTEHRYSAQDAAVYVEPNDELKFAQAISALIHDPERREKMGQFGRQRLEKELAWRYSAVNLLNVYQQLQTGLQEKPLPHSQ